MSITKAQCKEQALETLMRVARMDGDRAEHALMAARALLDYWKPGWQYERYPVFPLPDDPPAITEVKD